MPRSAGAGSEVTEASSISSPDDTVPGLNNKTMENGPKPAELETRALEEAKKDGGPATTNKENRERKKKAFSVDPDSDSDASSDSAPDYYIRRLAMSASSLSLFNAYKERMKRKAETKDQRNQGSNLVKGLVDYLRVLEDRIDQLESDTGTKAEKVDEPSIRLTESSNSTVEVAVKFFNSAAYLGEDGSYLKAVDETEKGTFTCGHDTQHLIRVLYSKIKNDGAEPLKRADCEPPNVGDIDILTLGVLSEPIAAFFAKQLDIDAEDDHLIRFGKPFRPLIRHLGRVREQLKKLESNYSRVVTEDVDKSGTIRDSSTEAPDATANREESDVLPFPPANNSENDSFPAYDRPAALPHFQAFLAFVDEFLGKQIQLYQRLREGKEQYVAFENLWMLFDANDTIYCPLREAITEEYNNVEGSDHTPIRRHTPQAYRVVATFGGMPLVRTMAPAFKLTKTVDTVAPVSLSNSFIGARANALADILTQTAEISRKIRNNYTEFNVYCFYLDFNGVEFGTVREVFIFKPYEREMEIRSLQAYPAHYLLRDQLYDHGRRFLDATRVSHLQYEGLTVGPSREEINSPVVVDMKLAFEGGPDTDKAFINVPEFKSPASLWLSEALGEAYDLFGKSNCPRKWCYGRECTSNVYSGSQRKQRDKIESNIKLVLEEYENVKQQGKDGLEQFGQLMADNDIIRLLPGAVPGFALRNRKWALLNLAQLGPVEQNNEWNKLVLPPGHRDMVQAMVETHTQDLGSNRDAKIGMDLVQGKGRGCIILLHGVPGVGKTSTAGELIVAQHILNYSDQTGDIGIMPGDVEKNMENHFKLAHRWGCVLLLDEADVFLAKRDQKDVQRNGLVSVFLRMLEYYSGILFLTTNRVGVIDDAFRSRLHLTLYYPKLTKKQSKQIFRQNFQRIADINADREKRKLPIFDYRDSEPKIMDWAMETWKTLRWNGRQIRNAFQTVLALAEFHAKNSSRESMNSVVTKKHFKIVASASVQFNKYLLATHGMDEDKTASRETMRALSFSPSSEVVFKAFDQDDSDSSSEGEDSSDGSGTDTDSDESDESDSRKKKKTSKEKKGKESKSSSKKSKKTSDKNEKSKKKFKEKKKERKEKEGSDD
ncbi:MAG: hypothetical protein Q9187_004598 [Circinaria calcarea]